jgi:hypothetical protein
MHVQLAEEEGEHIIFLSSLPSCLTNSFWWKGGDSGRRGPACEMGDEERFYFEGLDHELDQLPLDRNDFNEDPQNLALRNCSNLLVVSNKYKRFPVFWLGCSLKIISAHFLML